ncbi:hypothetical protein, partial [Candidatus Avelusimicrobium fimicolum]|uniref:hypothetical protein n=1 Tax=Candidatus Avelusimicrobium fimicolum TaxID=3416216 RepID=UPI003D0C93AA
GLNGYFYNSPYWLKQVKILFRLKRLLKATQKGDKNSKSLCCYPTKSYWKVSVQYPLFPFFITTDSRLRHSEMAWPPLLFAVAVFPPPLKTLEKMPFPQILIVRGEML